jgi:hypothetical protein
MTLAQIRTLPEEQEGGSYALSWAWIHLLMNQHRAELDAFFAGLNAGEAPQAAFARAFGAEPPGALEARLRTYVFTDMPGWTAPQPDVSRLELSVKELPEARVHALKAKLFVRDKPPVQDPQRFIDFELAEALRLEPGQPEARLLQAEQLQDPQARYAAAKAIALSSDDDHAWSLLAQWLIEQPELDAPFRQEVFARAGARLDDPRALTLAALGMGMLGDLALAKRHAERARALAPWSTAAAVAVAVVAKLQGECAAADEATRTAIALMRHRGDANAAEAMSRKLTAIKCPP